MNFLSLVFNFVLGLFSIFLFINGAYGNNPTLIDALMPSGFSLAQEYKTFQNPEFTKDILYSQSAVIHDFNGDGLKDVAMLVEKTICLIPYVQGKCTDNFYYAGESRKLLIYLAVNRNEYKLFLETENGILNYGESRNENNDPLFGFWVDENGALTISYEGGTELRWSFDIQFNFINYKSIPDFYVTAVRSVWAEWAVYQSKINNDHYTYYLDRDFVNGSQEVIKYLYSQQTLVDDGYYRKVSRLQNLELAPLRSANHEFLFKSEIK